jgi:hypothetical protein
MRLSIAMFFLVSFVVAEQDEKTCAKLERKFSRGFLTVPERDVYCMSGCNFLNVQCVSEKQSDIDWASIFDGVTNFAKRLLDEDVFSIISEPDWSADDVTIDVWITLLHRVWTISFCIVPLFLNQWKFYNFWWAMILSLTFMSSAFLGYAPFAIMIHNSILCFFAYAHGAGSHHLFESVFTMVILLGAVFMMFVYSPFWQFIHLIWAVIGFIFYIRYNFFVKRNASGSALVIAISQLTVMLDQLEFTRMMFAQSSLAGAGIEMCLSSVLPVGRSTLFTINAIHNAGQVVRKTQFFALGPWALLCMLMLHIGIFVGFRMCLGAYYLHTLRYKKDIKTLFVGLWVYLVDFFGPFRCAFRMAFKYEEFSTRRVMYAGVAFILMYHEMHAARELFLLRLFMSAFDVVFVKSSYGRATHYLEFNVDFMQSVFPQDGALPWFSIELLAAISKNVNFLNAERANNTVRGLGVLLNSAGSTMLYTVDHVVRKAQAITFNNVLTSQPDFRPVTMGDDPMVAMKYAHGEYPDVPLITNSETLDVALLVFINLMDDGEKVITMVPKFETERCKLYATVNLKKGDSGGPCFAIMNDGTIRLCGVVSRGNPRKGGGNIIAFSYSDGTISPNSDDDASLGEVKQFNAVRRARFDLPVEQNYTFVQLNEIIQERREDLVHMRDWARTPTIDDVMDYQRNKEFDFNPFCADFDVGAFQRDNPDDPDGKKFKRAKKAFNQKERAAVKRGFMVLSSVLANAQLAYDKVDAMNIFNALARGYVPHIDNREFKYICGTNGWICDETPHY